MGERRLIQTMLNRIKKRLDVIFMYERKQGRGIGDVWSKVDVVLKAEQDKLDKVRNSEEQKINQGGTKK